MFELVEDMLEDIDLIVNDTDLYIEEKVDIRPDRDFYYRSVMLISGLSSIVLAHAINYAIYLFEHLIGTSFEGIVNDVDIEETIKCRFSYENKCYYQYIYYDYNIHINNTCVYHVESYNNITQTILNNYQIDKNNTFYSYFNICSDPYYNLMHHYSEINQMVYPIIIFSIIALIIMLSDYYYTKWTNTEYVYKRYKRDKMKAS